MTQPTSENAREALLALRNEIAKVVVGQDAVVSGLVIAPAVPRPRAARGGPRRGQDPVGAHPGRGAAAGVQAGAVHTPT